MYGLRVLKTEKLTGQGKIQTYHIDPDLMGKHWRIRDKINIISIDPGIKNLAILFETRYLHRPEIEIKFLKNYLVNMDVDKKDFGCTDMDNLFPLFMLIQNLLKDLYKFFSQADIMIVERQLPHNFKSRMVFNSIINATMCLYPHIVIYDIQPSAKTKVISDVKLGPKEIKRQSIKIALQMMKKINDRATFEKIWNNRKADDMADVICQIEAFMDLWGLPIISSDATINWAPTVVERRKILKKNSGKIPF